jgi:hypothetical protein
MTPIRSERIENRIYMLRGHKVLLSTDLADLYEVEPRALVQAVKRNIERFPADFMFQLTDREFENLKSQIVTSSWGGLNVLLFASQSSTVHWLLIPTATNVIRGISAT